MVAYLYLSLILRSTVGRLDRQQHYIPLLRSIIMWVRAELLDPLSGPVTGFWSNPLSSAWSQVDQAGRGRVPGDVAVVRKPLVALDARCRTSYFVDPDIESDSCFDGLSNQLARSVF